MFIVDLLMGPRVSNREPERRKPGALQVVPSMGMDRLSSSVLAVLAAAGSDELSSVPWRLLSQDPNADRQTSDGCRTGD